MSDIPFGPNARINITMTTTMQSMADQLKIHTKLQNFFNVGQIDMQPMQRLATNVNQMLLSRRMPWKFNRVEMGSNNPQMNPYFFITQQGFQDIRHAGATCFTLINSTTPGGSLPAGGASVDLVPGTYQNGNALVKYGTFNGGPTSFGKLVNWQTSGIIFNPATGTFTVQFLDPHPFLPAQVGTTPILIFGIVNPAYNSMFVWNGLTQFSSFVGSYSLVSIPDIYHIVLQGTNGQYAPISAISQTGGIVTVTAPNTMLPGDIMTFTGLTLNPSMNGVTVTLLTASTLPPPGDLQGQSPQVSTVTFALPTGITIINGSETGTMYAAPSGAPGIFNFGWLEAANLIDINNPSFPLPVTPCDGVHRLPPEYTSTGDTLSVSAEIDYGDGVIKFRLSEPVSTYPFAFCCTFQARAPLFNSPSSVFQWPDYLSWVLFEMLLWQGMRFAYGATAQETQAQMQQAAIALQAALSSEDREANDMALTPQWSLER